MGPAGSQPVPEIPDPRGPAGAVKGEVKEGMVPTISVVDDDEAVRAALRMLILSFGWKVQAFESGQAFLDRIDSAAPDCVVLDLNMPGMNGAEVQENLRDRGSRVPVVIVTGQRDSGLLSRARAAGAGALLGKPFDDETLKASIEAAIRLTH